MNLPRNGLVFISVQEILRITQNIIIIITVGIFSVMGMVVGNRISDQSLNVWVSLCTYALRKA